MEGGIHKLLRFLLLPVFIFSGIFIQGQTGPGDENRKPDKIVHRNSDVMKVNPDRFDGNPFAYGNVVFEHEGTKLYSDSAVFYPEGNRFLAWSNVRVINDTVSMSSDSLAYDGNTRLLQGYRNVHLKDRKSELLADYVEYDRNTDLAVASGNVVIIDPGQRIETQYMTYDRANGIAHTDQGAMIFGEDGTVTHTQILTYNANTKTIDFERNTTIQTPDYTINSSHMTMNQQTDVTEFLAHSVITDRKNPRNYIEMPTGGGIFKKRSGEVFLKKRSTIYRDGKELHGDEMYFDDKTGYGWAKGDVLINDPEEKRFIRGEWGEAFRDVDSAYVTGRAYAVKVFELDSLYFHADTIMAVQRKDSVRVIKAYYNARFFKTDAQGKSDSIFYNENVGLLKSFRDPIIWSAEQQITGDTIYIYNNPINEVMDSVRVFNNAFVISKSDSLTDKDYNQVKGKFMIGYFLNNKLKFVEVHENAQSVSYIDEEDKESKEKERIGINLSDCGLIEAEITDDQIEVLACRIQANSRLYPESKLPEEQRRLKGFDWRGGEKMKRWQDIFGDPPDLLLEEDEISAGEEKDVNE